jgi:DDE superfamily endonuclease
MQRWHQRGTVQPDRIGGSKRSTLAAHAERVHALLVAEPDLTIAELRTRLAAEGIAMRRSAVGRFLTAAGLTRKKDPARRRAESAGCRRRPARLARAAARPDPERLVFIDETWATTAMARRYSRARRGARVAGAVPHGHWKTTTFIAALRADGLSAPCVFDGAINGARFRAYVEQNLAPTLRPGDVVVMDNLRAHKVRRARSH